MDGASKPGQHFYSGLARPRLRIEVVKSPPRMGPLSFSLMSLYEHHLAQEDSSEGPDAVALLLSSQRGPSYWAELQAVSITSIHLPEMPHMHG